MTIQNLLEFLDGAVVIHVVKVIEGGLHQWVMSRRRT